MFEQIFKNIDDILWKDAGASSELDYTEQTSWLLFLKYLDDLEDDRAAAATLANKSYKPILAPEYQWKSWAAPKTPQGEIDYNRARTGDDLKAFVAEKLFPHLRSFRERTDSTYAIEYKIGEIFSEISNKIQSGYVLRDVLDQIDKLRFRSQKEKFELSELYEAKIRNMGNAGRNGGEYYTPRPLIRAIIEVVRPVIGQTVYDGAAGSAGFLCEALAWMSRSQKTLSAYDRETLQKRTFFGKEKKSLAYVIAVMNMILHGLEAPNILHTNTLNENLSDIQEKDRFDIILANPPFGGKERREVQQNFSIKTGETAFLFLQHFIKMLRAGGRAGVVIKNTFLSNTDQAAVALRRMLLADCRLHTILDLPGGTFQGAGVKTVVLFFDKGLPTDGIWYYQLAPGRSMGKTNPLNDDDLAEFVHLQKTKADSPRSWTVQTTDLDQVTYDLSLKNPHRPAAAPPRRPADIIAEMAALDAESAAFLAKIKNLTEKRP